MITLSTNIVAILYTMWGFLVSASLLVISLIKIKPHVNYDELIRRTKSWWVMLGVFTFAFVTNRTVSFIFLGFISFLALKEFFSIIPTRRVDRRVLFWAYLAIPFQFYLAAIAWYGMFITFIPVFMCLFIPFRLLISRQTEGFLKSVGTIQWGLMITVFSLSHMAYLLALPNLAAIPITGTGLLLYLVLLTQLNDISQYIFGKLLGKSKIIPEISPKKTWAGLMGGLFITLLLSIAIYRLLTPFSFSKAIFAGLIISIGGFVGDVVISAVKRDLGIKDTSAMIPGHGGVLDRVDSLTYTAPLFFHFVYYCCY